MAHPTIGKEAPLRKISEYIKWAERAGKDKSESEEEDTETESD